eukprot:gene16022-46918_t
MPGASSLFGLLSEIGPIEIDLTGTKVSFRNLTAVNQFFGLFDHLQSNEFYENAKGTLPHIPLAGMSIGDGLSDPESMIAAYPAMCEQLSLVDWNQRKAFDEMINGDLTGFDPYLANVTGFSDYFNALSPRRSPAAQHACCIEMVLRGAKYPQPFGEKAPFVKWLNQPAVQDMNTAVEKAIVMDFAQSMRDLYPTILANYSRGRGNTSGNRMQLIWVSSYTQPGTFSCAPPLTGVSSSTECATAAGVVALPGTPAVATPDGANKLCLCFTFGCYWDGSTLWWADGTTATFVPQATWQAADDERAHDAAHDRATTAGGHPHHNGTDDGSADVPTDAGQG